MAAALQHQQQQQSSAREPLYISTALHCSLLHIGCPCPVVSQQGIEGRAVRFATIQRRTSSSSSIDVEGSRGMKVVEAFGAPSSSSSNSLAVIVEPPADLVEQFMFPGVLQSWGVATSAAAVADSAMQQQQQPTQAATNSSELSSSSNVETTSTVVPAKGSSQQLLPPVDGFRVASALFENHFGLVGSSAPQQFKRPRES